MAGKQVSFKTGTISAVTTTGYVTIASTTGWYATAKGTLIKTAGGTLTATGNFSDLDTVTIGSKVYTFQTVLTNVDGNVLIGATASDSLDNLIAAIMLGAGSGVKYAAATTANTDVSAVAGAGDTMDVTALKAGTVGNSVATTDTSATASWGATTLTGGDNKQIVITEIQSATVMGVRILPDEILSAFTSGIANGGPNYGRSNMSSYNGATINQMEQFIYNSNDLPLS